MTPILLIDDEIENLKALERTLRPRFSVTLESDPLKALALLQSQSFAVVLSDQKMPVMTGAEFLTQAAKIDPLAVRVLLTAFPDTKEMCDAINRAEIYRYLTKPWDNDELLSVIQQAANYYYLVKKNQELLSELESANQKLREKEKLLVIANRDLEKTVAERTQELQEANEKLAELAMTDPLTKTLNRRPFFAKLQEEIERSKRHRRPIAVAMVDIDHFKTFNDMEGHIAGDEALKKVVQILSSNLRKSDSLCRYGGEEFLVLFPETHPLSGEEICERLRAQVERDSFQGGNNQAYLTVSIGLASYPNDGEEAESLIKAADRALYVAKDKGRNRVVVFDESLS